MSAPQSNEERELSLVDKVEFRIALADTDVKLQNILNTYLCPLLLKLTSEHKSVRNKVISICHQVLNRIKPQNIQLPVKALLKQFQENPHAPLLRHFDLLYVHQGIQRLSKNDQATLAGVLIPGVGSSASVSAAHGAKIFNFFLRALGNYPIPSRGDREDEELRSALGASDDDVSFLAFWISKLFSLRLNVKSANTVINAPGLSGDEWSFLTVEGNAETWDQSKEGGLNLTATKIKCLQFLSSGFFNDKERFWPVIYASADPNSNISEPAGDLLKRLLPNADLEQKSTIEKLFDLYFGFQPIDPGTANTFVPGVTAPMRTTIASILSRSLVSSTFTEKILRMAEQDLLQDFQRLSSTSMANREMLKLRSAVMSYLYYIARNAFSADLNAVSRPLIQHLREFINEESHNDFSQENRSLRGSSFEIIGNLAASNRQVLLEPNLDLLSWLFQSLSGERDKEVVISIDQALSVVLFPLQRVKDLTIQKSLETLLLKCAKQDSINPRNLRYATVRFANRCLPFDNLCARWIDMIALGNASTLSHETIAEAKDGMNPYWHQRLEELEVPGSTIIFPKFSAAIDYLFWDQRAQSDIETSIIAIEFCRKALICSLLAAHGKVIEFDSLWDLKLDQMVAEDQEARTTIREQLMIIAADANSKTELATLWQCALSATSSDRINFSKRAATAKVLVDLLALLPSEYLRQTNLKFTELESSMLASDDALRLSSAEAFGLLIAHTNADSSPAKQSLSELLYKVASHKDAVGRQKDKIPGAILGLGFSLSRGLYLNPSNSLFRNALNELMPKALQILDEKESTYLHEASIHALGQLCMFSMISPETIDQYSSWNKVIETIQKLALKENSTAISVLGYMSMLLDEDKHNETLQSLLVKIQELHEIKQAETQFAVGEALVCVAVGWRSTVMPPKLDVQGPIPQSPAREQTLEPLLDKILQDCATTTKPSLKKASVIWLLSFVQFAYKEPAVQTRLRRMQATFRRCLSDRNEFVQESASRGLSLVYEKGDQDLKNELIKDLLQSFSSDKAEVSGTVTQDTELFEPGTMRTDEGSSVNTYKDIMSLASEMGDSSLVYRFMSLASHDAIWSSRTAYGRFGLSNLLSDAQAEGHLVSNPKLFAKLYRYRFDPNTKVRRSMDEIWNGLVKDTVATLDTHFDDILIDLLGNVLGKEWRTREASCGAITALIQSSKLEKVVPYNEQLWNSVFKVLDDIKQSVRTAAVKLLSTLVRLITQSLESDNGKSDTPQKMLENAIPFLFGSSGVESKAKGSGVLATATILNLIRNAKPDTLRPFVPDLVENLLNLLAEHEPLEANYAHLAAERLNVPKTEIDTVRAQAARSSPIMGVIEKCLECLDEKSMQNLSSRLQSAMRSAIAIPTKIGCSQVLMSLSVHHSVLFKPYTDKFLDIVPKYLVDRSEAVATSYALSLGYVARGASDKAISKLASVANDLYFESEEERSRRRAGDILHAVTKLASDRFAALASAFLPLMFFGCHDQDEEVREAFKGVWENSATGSRVVLQYLQEIVKLSGDYITSRRWVLKHTAALPISALVEAITTAKGKMTIEETNLIWPVLKTALAEKSWDGKEQILAGFVAFAKYKATEADVNGDIAKIAVREAKRRNSAYQSFAIDSLAKAAAYVGESELSSNSILSVVESVISEFADASETNNGLGREPKSEGEQQKTRNRAMIGAIDAVFAAIKIRKGESDQANRDMGMIPRGLDLASKANATSHLHHTVQSPLLANLKSFFEQLRDHPEARKIALEPQDSAGRSFLPKQIEEVVFAPHAALAKAPDSLRVQRSETVLALAELYRQCGGGAVPPSPAFAIRAPDEISERARQNLQAAADIFGTLERP